MNSFTDRNEFEDHCSTWKLLDLLDYFEVENRRSKRWDCHFRFDIRQVVGYIQELCNWVI